MKLIIQNNRIAGTATDEYTGPEEFMTAPHGFDVNKMGDYTVDGGVLTTPPLTLADYDAALTAHLDAEAQTRRYADRVSCSVRAGYVGPFQAEGIAFAQWMDACNATGYSMLEDFQKGIIPQPTIAEMIAALPAMVWPA